MNCKLSYIIVGLILSAPLLASCQNKKSKDGRTDTYSSGAITFALDEGFSPATKEERELLRFTYPEAKPTPIYTNESNAINGLLKGEVLMAITSCDSTKDELENLRADKRSPRSTKFAYDGPALVQNINNMDSCISADSIRKIFNGEIIKWSQIYPHSKIGDITVVFDSPNSSATRYVEDSILGGKLTMNKNVAAVKKTEGVIKYIEENKGVIGIIGSSWLNDKCDSTSFALKKETRSMAVSSIPVVSVQNSWKSYQCYFCNVNYPLVCILYILLNDTHVGLPTGFFSFIIS